MFLRKKFDGVSLFKNKEATERKKIKQLESPKIIMLPMNMHIGSEAEPVVSVGEKVCIGTLIGKKSGFISANIHSSVSGKVTSIKLKKIGNNNTTVVTIRNDFKDTYVTTELKGNNLAEIAESAGIVGMGGAGFPTNVKLDLNKSQVVDTLIINAAECEPNVTADRRLIIENVNMFLNTIKKIRKELKIMDCVIAIEQSSKKAIYILQKKLKSKKNIRLKILPDHYPQGAEKLVIKSVLDRELPKGSLPIDMHVMILNTSTLFALSHAINQKKYLTERVVTVSGTPLKNPGNFKVRIGTPISELIDACGGFTEAPDKLINGGPMMGKTIHSLDEPVTKTTSLILALNRKESYVEKESPCIRCSKCVNVCPINLQPILIHEANKKNDLKRLEELETSSCIECGLCTYICPSKINILESIKEGKQKLQQEKARRWN